MGLLNQDFQGSYQYEGREVRNLSDSECSKIRASRIGFVFQNYSLIHHLKVWENVELALAYAKLGGSVRERKLRVGQVLESVGLQQRRNDRPNKLSGGEQQRVAIARALVTSPSLIVCDEPTGALDNETSGVVMELLKGLVSEQGATLFLVTHDEELAASCDTVMRMDRGGIIAYFVIQVSLQISTSV